MFDLTETVEGSISVPSNPFYTHDDGSHWVHSSLYGIDYPRVDCWFTPDALVLWYPEVFTYDLKTPVSPLLGFPTFAPKRPGDRLKDYVNAEWVVGTSCAYVAEEVPYGYVFVNDWGMTSACIDCYKEAQAESLELYGIIPRNRGGINV